MLSSSESNYSGLFTPIHVRRDGFTKIFSWFNIFKVVEGVIKVNLLCHSHSVMFGHVTLCLSIGFELSFANEVFLPSSTEMNI